MKVTVDPGSKSTFSMVRDRTVEMVSHTRILNGVSLFLLGLSDAALLSSALGDDVANESTLTWSPNESTFLWHFVRIIVLGLLVGCLLVILGFKGGNAFPAVKLIGLCSTLNSLVFLLL